MIVGEGLNNVQCIGNLGGYGELRMTPGGQAVLKLNIACNG